MNDKTIDNALDRDDLLSLVILLINTSCGNLVIFKRLKEDVAVANEKLLAQDADQSDALKSKRYVFFVTLIENAWMDNHLTDLDHAMVVQVGQTTLLEKTPTQSQTSFEGQLLFQMSLFNNLDENLDLAVALKEFVHVKVIACTAELLNILNFVLQLLVQLGAKCLVI